MEHPTKRSILIFNTLPWYTRLPIKWAILGFTVFVVCFPYPNLFVRHLCHWRNPNALIEPDAPALQPWVAELRPLLPADHSPPETLRRVEQFVYEKVPYDWDWNTWGQSDYLPTVTELIEVGKEDCDGRAVIAASLLQKFGFRTQIVTDFAHVWVKTDQGELMGPGRRKAIVATERGLQFHWRALAGLPEATVYGIAVFPLIRELIVLFVAWWLLLRANIGTARCLLALVLLCTGLLVLRKGASEYLLPIQWMQIVGVFAMAAGVVLLQVGSRRSTQIGPNAADPL